jgi:outer membrane protein
MSRLKGAAIAAVLLVGWSALPARAQTAPPKLAYVNMAAILQNAPGRAQAESTFQHELAVMQQQATVLQNQLDSAVNEFNRAALVLSAAAKDRRQQELVRMRDRTQQQVQDLQTRAQQRQQELVAPITQRIQAVIEGVRAEYGYAMIFDASAQSGALVTADRSLDITPLVIQRLQTGATQPAAPPPLAAPATGDTSRPAPARPPRP